MTILVTGGAGYIGSHTCVELLTVGRDIVILDNFCNSSPRVLDRIGRITGRRPALVEADLRSRSALDAVFRTHAITSVIHFAGLKAVGESVAQPMRYYENNVAGSLNLFQAMAAAGVKTLVFSSSATVYGDPARVPIREDAPLAPTNPYGRTKLMIEDMLRDIGRTDPAWRVALLRYFNPVGAHASGLLGEDPAGIPNNLMPFIARVAVGRLPELLVFGDDYGTPDGTGVRDYIHVVDLARGHLAALDVLERHGGVFAVNLGTGRGYSVLEMIRAFERASSRTIPYRIAPRRPGDVAACYADPALAARLLGWRAQRGVDEMCADTWRWQSGNPMGYAD
ncbi:MAG: UDP-glucose 4-epimerase GalE [Pseudomonadota bacterium]|jgi:UDP-glucose 4-epimerase